VPDEPERTVADLARVPDDPLRPTQGWANTALEREVDAVRLAPEGSRNDTLNRAAFNLGQLLPEGHLDEGDVRRGLTEAALQAGLGYPETLTAIASGLGAGMEHPRGPRERPESPVETPGEVSGLLGTPLARSALSGLPRASPLIEGVLSTPAAAVLVGGYGVGKSVLVHGLACAVALGVPWLGRPTRSARVLIVVGEGAWGLHDRLGAWEQAWNAGRPIPDDRLSFMLKPRSLSSPLTWAALTTECLAQGIGLVILDTFSSLAPDADETKDAAKIMRYLSDLSSAINGTALLVHHPGWSDSGRTRGGYQFEANADEVLVMTEVAENAGLIQVLRKKVKDGPSGSAFHLRRVPMGESVVFQHALPEEADGLPAAILAALMDMGSIGATGPQLRSMLGVAEGGEYRAFYRALTALKDAGKVTSEGSRRSEVYRAVVT
jgi:hypothetical protein